MLKNLLVIPILLWPQVLGDSCNALFVVDGSSYWNSFRGEIVSISTVANILYSTTNFTSSFWMYGDDNQDDRIPTTFYSTEQDFLDNIQELGSYGGRETVVGATSKLNDWQTYALIVLYTASSQTLINVAGTNYTEQARTVAIHQNDGIDLRPISNYPSYQMSDYTNVVDVITNACKHFPMKTTTPKTQPTTTRTLKPSTSTSARPQSTVSPSLPICHGLFVIDGSKYATIFESDKTFVSAAAHLGYTNPNMTFTGNIWMYGSDHDLALPNTWIDQFSDIQDAIYDLNAYNGDESIAGAVLHLNDWQEQNVVIVLFTQSPQSEIDLAASEYLKKDFTLAIPLNNSLDLTNLAAVTKGLQDFPGIGDAIEDLCLRRTKTISPAPISMTSPTKASTISPLDPSICYGLFVFDGSKQMSDFASEQSLGRVAAIQSYHNLDYPFNGNVWMYGNGAGDETIPTTFIETYDELGDLIVGLVSYNGIENVTGAVNHLNAWSENEAIIILYSASDQVDIDAAAKNYQKKTSTLGLSWQDKTDLSKLAAVTVSPTDFDGIKVALNTLCQAKLATTTGSIPKTIVV